MSTPDPIRAEALTRDFRGLRALDALSFVVPQGQVVGFLGVNGAGKTTTLRILTGDLAPTSGAAWIGGRPVSAMDGAFREALGYLPESNPLYPALDVVEYLQHVGRCRGIARGQRRRAVARAVELCELGDFRRRDIAALSKGMRQRVGLAQAIMHAPRVLILDEPASGLDPRQREQIRGLIRALAQESTVLFSSHDLTEVRAVADRVLILDRGRLVADGAPDALTRRVIEVVLAGPTPATAASRLRALEGVAEVTTGAEPDSSGAVHLQIRPAADADARAAVAAAVHAAGWDLLELRAGDTGLEALFLRLTGERD
jgi:ABC-2 type transport system ATP-binding protein